MLKFDGSAAWLAACIVAVLSLQSTSDAVEPSKNLGSFLGNGVVKTLDIGEMKTASFLPSAIVQNPKTGEIIVADSGGNRIWILRKGESAKVIAGVPAAANTGDEGPTATFRDGQLKDARFNSPTGVAVRPDGGIYVSDTKNFCVRLIKDGVVSTIAGSPSEPGSADGAGDVAHFAKPGGLFLNNDGRLFIADGINGVRVLSNSEVSTLALSKSFPHDVINVSGDPTSAETTLRFLFYSTSQGFGRYDFAEAKSGFF